MIDKQFLVGPAFLVTPVLEEGKRSVTGYFPFDDWYNFYDGHRIASTSTPNGKWVELLAQIDYIPLHVRGGHIMPTQEKALTTEFSRKNPFGLVVAPNEYGEAQGDLFFDDGESQDVFKSYFYATYSLRDNKIKMNIEHNTYDGMTQLTLNKIRLFTDHWSNVDFTQWTFYLNKVKKLSASHVLVVDHEIVLFNLEIPMTSDFELEWSLDPQKFKVDTVDDSAEISHPIIDCSIRNERISEADCRKKNCEYNGNNTGSPKCYIPPAWAATWSRAASTRMSTAWRRPIRSN